MTSSRSLVRAATVTALALGVWNSGRVPGGESSTGTVRSGRGSAWALSFSLSSAQSGGGGEVPIGSIRGC